MQKAKFRYRKEPAIDNRLLILTFGILMFGRDSSKMIIRKMTERLRRNISTKEMTVFFSPLLVLKIKMPLG